MDLDVIFYYEKKIYRYVTSITVNKTQLESRIMFEKQKLYEKQYFPSKVRSIFDYNDYKEIKVDDELLGISFLNKVLKTPTMYALPYLSSYNYSPILIPSFKK